MLRTKGTASLENAFALLNCRRLPGRLNTSEAALLLGVQEHDIPVLVAARLILPLGKPALNAPKYFAATEIVERAADSEWLAKGTKALARHWQVKNQRRQLTASYFV